MLEIKGTDLIPVEFDPFAGEPHLTLPLTRQQSEVWVEFQMGREASCAFNQCFVLHLRGPLSTSSLPNALDEVLADTRRCGQSSTRRRASSGSCLNLM